MRRGRYCVTYNVQIQSRTTIALLCKIVSLCCTWSQKNVSWLSTESYDELALHNGFLCAVKEHESEMLYEKWYGTHLEHVCALPSFLSLSLFFLSFWATLRRCQQLCYTAGNGNIVDEWKWSWPNRRIIPWGCVEALRKTSARISGFLDDDSNPTFRIWVQPLGVSYD
jgi:hypothetical protein